MVNVTSIHHLALFICHLFIDGHFRTAHILYKPNTFEFDWLLQIDTVCPGPIPFYLTDVTLPWEWPWNSNDTPENVLQLSFFDTGHSDIDQVQQGYAHYCALCLPSHDAINAKQRTSIFTALRQFSDTKVILVNYNTVNVSVFIDSKYSNEQPIFFNDNETNFEEFDLFDRTFGEYERTRSIAIQRVDFIDKSAHGMDIDYEYMTEVIWLHYYHLHLNNSFINMTWIDDEESPPFLTNQQCTLQSPDYYKELAYKYHCAANGNP